MKKSRMRVFRQRYFSNQSALNADVRLDVTGLRPGLHRVFRSRHQRWLFQSRPPLIHKHLVFIYIIEIIPYKRYVQNIRCLNYRARLSKLGFQKLFHVFIARCVLSFFVVLPRFHAHSVKQQSVLQSLPVIGNQCKSVFVAGYKISRCNQK